MTRLWLLVLSFAIVPFASGETLRVLALDSEPFLFQNNGSPAGIEFEILDYFAKSRNQTLSIEFVGSFPELLDRIAKGEADIAAGTITITADRDARMDFSAPYFPVQVVLVERADERTGSVEDLKGRRIAAFEKTTAEEALKAIPGVEVVRRSGIEAMLDAIVSGEIEGAAADSSAVIPALDAYPSLKISLTFGEQQGFGFALPEGSPHRKPLSQTILRLKESGIYFRLVTQYMGPRASEIVRAAKAR